MKKVFHTTYESHDIQVINTWLDGEKLFINGKLQDENLGLAFRATLRGVLIGKDQSPKHIKVSLGGLFTIHCKIFVDNTLVYSK